MQNGYKILWTDHALEELKNTILYIEEHWTEKEVRNLIVSLEHTLALLASNPNIFPVSEKKKIIRRAVVLKHNSLYFRLKNKNVEILSFFSHRQNPKKRKL